jgi:hypothetical protein
MLMKSELISGRIFGGGKQRNSLNVRGAHLHDRHGSHPIRTGGKQVTLASYQIRR